MNFNESKLKFKSRINNINFSSWSSNFLLKKNRIFLLIFSAAIFGYCAYLWYNYLYHSGWSNDRKQEYIESKKEANVVLNKNKLNKVILELENRQNNFQKADENIPDIFAIE